MIGKQKTILASLVIVALIVSVGIVSAHGNFKLNKTIKFGAGEHLDAVIKEKLGLPENASKEDVMATLKQKMEERKIERLKVVREKLGLPENASEEEVKTALNEWREENKDLIRGFGRHGRFGMHGKFRTGAFAPVQLLENI